MALQLQSYADLRPDALHVFSKPVCGSKTRTWTTRRRAQAADIRVSLTERSNGMPSSSVAAPGYSSLLRRSRRHEMKLDAGDRITQIAEWVSRKVKDPLVEIDPVTVGKRIKKEQEEVEEQMARQQQVVAQDEIEATDESSPPSEETIATVAASTFDQPPPGFPRGMDNSTKAAAGAALILATAGVAYLACRSKTTQSNSKQKSGSLSASPAPSGIGGIRDVGTPRIINHSPGTEESSSSPPQDLHEQFLYSDGDTSDKAVSLRASVVLTSFQSQSTTTVSMPAFSSHKENTLSPSVTPHEPREEEEVGKAGSQEDLSFTSSPSDDDLPVAKPFEEVVAVNGVGRDSNSAGEEVEAVEIQNALLFYKPQAAKELLSEDLRTSVSEDYKSAAAATSEYVDDLAEVSDVESPGVEFQNAMVSDTPSVETSRSEVKRVDDEPPALPVVEDVQMAGILNGAAATESDANADEERRKSYVEALQAVVPAIAVGAGAVSTLTGLDSGLEMVGLVATASFVAREIFLHSSRAQLWGEVRKVKDHKSFMDFLKSRDIIKDVPQE